MDSPPYLITPKIIQLITTISEKMGRVNAHFLDKPSPQLRKTNRIRTIHSSLAIEGNTLTEEQITAILEEKRVIGPEKDVKEVLNAIKVYDHLHSFDPLAETSFLRAHELLMNGLVHDKGSYRKKGVGIMAGDKIAHMAPPASNVPYLMRNLFQYLQSTTELALIKSCVFHYEMEFIHPFTDGNGRMGRLWQTAILLKEYPIFEFIPIENGIHNTQNEYYHALSMSDKAGNSTPFIEYMLGILDISLTGILNERTKMVTAKDRLDYFLETQSSPFSRRKYMAVFKHISTATASRDLKQGIDLGMLSKVGDKNKTTYIKTAG